MIIKFKHQNLFLPVLLVFIFCGYQTAKAGSAIIEANTALRQITHNEFLAPDSGSTWENGISLGYKPQAYFGLILGYRQGSYKLSETDSSENTSITGTWSTQNLTTAIQLSLPLNYSQPFFRLGALIGKSHLELNSQSTFQSTSGSQLKSNVALTSDLDSQGAFHEIGVRFGRGLGFAVSSENSYEVWKFKSFTYGSTSSVDGVAEAIDKKDPDLYETAVALLGKRIGHMTHAIKFSIDIEY